ncbi:MAG TPA: Asp23/Gls24 family envelope stress response protein [Trueperaceae bacterium]
MRGEARGALEEELKVGQRSKTSSTATAERDKVVVTDGALATIVGLAAHEVPGVVGMAPASIREGINRMLGASRADEGVEVQRDGEHERKATIELHVVVAYGVNIPVVAESVRERVRYAAKEFAGVQVIEVKVHIAGVSRG